MTIAISTLISEFASDSESQAYNTWFKARIEQALADPRARIPHDMVMSDVQALIASKRKANTLDYAD